MRAICLSYRPECGDCSHGIWHDWRVSCINRCDLRTMDVGNVEGDMCFYENGSLIVYGEVDG